MPDFTSALFLGHSPGPGQLQRWTHLTTGRPAALDEPQLAGTVAARVAAAQGAPAGVVHRSSLHALGDVVELCGSRADLLLVDAGAYPVVKAAVGRALIGRRPRVAFFRHHDAAHAARVARGVSGRTVILTDGWCAGCDRPAPLDQLEAVAAEGGGLLVVDDTQAAGVLGARQEGQPYPFGEGGGGTFAWLGAQPTVSVLVTSLAKGYGAPLTVTSGPARLIARLGSFGSRCHASPPTRVDLLAAQRATADILGNARRRRRLAGLVLALRRALRTLRLPVIGLPFPLVHTALPTSAATRALGDRLTAAGVHALLLAPTCLPTVTLSFAVTAEHRPADIAAVSAALRSARGQVAS